MCHVAAPVEKYSLATETNNMKAHYSKQRHFTHFMIKKKYVEPHSEAYLS